MSPSVFKAIPPATLRISVPVTMNAIGESEAGGLSRPNVAQAKPTAVETCR